MTLIIGTDIAGRVEAVGRSVTQFRPETGKVRPVMDRRFELSQVPAAVRYIEDGHCGGKVVISI